MTRTPWPLDELNAQAIEAHPRTRQSHGYAPGTSDFASCVERQAQGASVPAAAPTQPTTANPQQLQQRNLDLLQQQRSLEQQNQDQQRQVQGQQEYEQQRQLSQQNQQYQRDLEAQQERDAGSGGAGDAGGDE